LGELGGGVVLIRLEATGASSQRDCTGTDTGTGTGTSTNIGTDTGTGAGGGCGCCSGHSSRMAPGAARGDLVVLVPQRVLRLLRTRRRGGRPTQLFVLCAGRVLRLGVACRCTHGSRQLGGRRRRTGVAERGRPRRQARLRER
jgi:hypothetical protein